MQVLLLKDVEQVGRAGEVKRVADGYARNFLIPRGLATMASPGAIKKAELERESAARRQAKELSEAQTLAQALDGRTVTFRARAGEQNRLYGSITKSDIAEELEKQVHQEVDRRKIELEDPIKELGTHAITIHLAPDAEAQINVVVERAGED
jgi:large subunit ribosomal protein L9